MKIYKNIEEIEFIGFGAALPDLKIEKGDIIFSFGTIDVKVDGMKDQVVDIYVLDSSIRTEIFKDTIDSNFKEI